MFELPEGLLDDPELAEIAERLPEGADRDRPRPPRLGAPGGPAPSCRGASASAPDLRALGSRLLAFYGQHEHRKLTLASAQLETLDGFAGRDAPRAARALPRRPPPRSPRSSGSWPRSASARERASATSTSCASSSRRSRPREPDPAEEAELAPERERLRHAEALRGAARGGARRRSRAADEDERRRLGGASASPRRRSAAQDGVDAVARRAGGASARRSTVELQELAAELRSYADGIEAEPGRLQQVEERLDVLDRLKRKHGGSIEAVLAHAERCRAEIERIEGAEERTEELERRLRRGDRATRASSPPS